MVAARRIVRRHYGRDHHPVYRTFARALVAITWPLAALVALWLFRQRPVPIRRVPGAFWAALRHNIVPGEYFAYGLWQSDRKVNIDSYLYGNEGPRLFKLLNRPLLADPIGDKLEFYQMCRAQALPSPEILAAFTSTGVLLQFESGLPPKRDLFVKLRIGLGSEGIERFRWHHGVFESHRGYHLSAEDLGRYLAARAATEKRTLLVQPALSNHPELPVDANANLATARLVTGISTEGDVIPIFGFFIYTVRTDRLVRVALLDVVSGRLLAPAPRTTRVSHQLDIGSDHACTLPNWNSVLKFTKAAHRTCCNFAFIGWDAAFTEQGAMLLEGNANWGASEYQRLQGEPLGYTKFAEILAARLHKLEAS
jgi:hypothetical protein